jgi:hypothetical protein
LNARVIPAGVPGVIAALAHVSSPSSSSTPGLCPTTSTRSNVSDSDRSVSIWISALVRYSRSVTISAVVRARAAVEHRM